MFNTNFQILEILGGTLEFKEERRKTLTSQSSFLKELLSELMN